ncbi:aldose 1-epimerase family protein [Klebsiella pneumoniae]|nr:aldose 1-epimerase family protein [Klebsiella pneumoniae]
MKIRPDPGRGGQQAGDKGASNLIPSAAGPDTVEKHRYRQAGLAVTGIEPGTSYAYPVTIEREQNA